MEKSSVYYFTSNSHDRFMGGVGPAGKEKLEFLAKTPSEGK